MDVSHRDTCTLKFDACPILPVAVVNSCEKNVKFIKKTVFMNNIFFVQPLGGMIPYFVHHLADMIVDVLLFE